MKYRDPDHIFWEAMLVAMCAVFLRISGAICLLTFNFASARTKCFLAFTRKYLLQFRVSMLWKNYGGRSSLKTQLKIEFLQPYTGSRKVLGNIPEGDVCIREISVWEISALERRPYYRDVSITEVCNSEMYIEVMSVLDTCMSQRDTCLRCLYWKRRLYQGDVYIRDVCITEVSLLGWCLYIRDVCIEKDMCLLFREMSVSERCLY